MRALPGVAAAAFVWLAPHAHCDVRAEGTPPFGAMVWFASPPKLSFANRLIVIVENVAAKEGSVRIELPPMLQSNAGPIITRAFDPHKESIAIDVVPNRGGMGVVRVMCRFESNGVVDEGEYELPVNVQSDTAVIETIRIVREERSLGGQRYRFGGRFMVPIDASERVSREDIENKPELIGRVVARGGNGQNRRVRCVAFIDKSGHARSVRVLAQDGLSVDEARAVEKAALKARYRPARAGQKLVADWVIVDVYLEER